MWVVSTQMEILIIVHIFFYDEDIAKVYFLGFSDEEEQEFKNSALEKISRTNFVHFKVEKEES